MKSSRVFNGLIIGFAVMATHLAIRELPDRRLLLPATVSLTYRPVALRAAHGPLQLAGAWVLEADDSRLGGVSALAIDGNRFLAVTDRGAVLRFDPPGSPQPSIWLADLRAGPGPFARKWGRDAESLVSDPQGRGWWVGYEQRHSLWLYDGGFTHALDSIDLGRSNWPDNRGAEGLIVRDGAPLVLGENGRDAIRIGQQAVQRLSLHAGAEVADAAKAPDGSAWLLLRKKGLGGIDQAIAPLLKTHDGYLAGAGSPVPKGAFDNYEGMAIEQRPGGGWRFWLISDDGHRVMARTLLVALDLNLPVTHDKSSATGAGPLRKW